MCSRRTIGRNRARSLPAQRLVGKTQSSKLVPARSTMPWRDALTWLHQPVPTPYCADRYGPKAVPFRGWRASTPERGAGASGKASARPNYSGKEPIQRATGQQYPQGEKRPSRSDDTACILPDHHAVTAQFPLADGSGQSVFQFLNRTNHGILVQITPSHLHPVRWQVAAHDQPCSPVATSTEGTKGRGWRRFASCEPESDPDINCWQDATVTAPPEAIKSATK